jgi:transposase InsO family protein
MRIRSNLKNTKGWLHMRERSIRFRYMITEKAKERAKILAFWKKHGLDACMEAYGVKRRTLFLWQAKLAKGNGKLESLNVESTAPKEKRKRLWDPRILEELKRLRFKHPNLGKEKLHPLLKRFCTQKKLACPEVRTIGRLIKDLGGLRMVPLRITGTGRVKPLIRAKVLRKPKDLVARYPGHVVALDTFEEHINGAKRYVITFIDLYTRFGFAFATSSHASKAAADFFALCAAVFPFPFTTVLTDNGSEFKKHFSAALLTLHLTHYHTRPRTPKQNAHAERFNRTVQEEFADWNRNELWLDIESFNRKLFEWLYWYNAERVHFAFDNKLSPIQFMLSLDPTTLPEECKSGWPHTRVC